MGTGKMTKYLFIDASENATYIQASNSNTYFNQIFDTHRNLGAKITEICDEMLQKAAVANNEIERFIVCTGPGSLTGLRVANSLLRTLAFLSERPLAGIDLFTWTAATLKADGKRGKVCLMAPTLIDKAFAVEVDLNTDLALYQPEPKLLENRLPHSEMPTFGIRWQNAGIEKVTPTPEALHHLIETQKANSPDFSELLKILPLYIIPSQAERKLEEKKC